MSILRRKESACFNASERTYPTQREYVRGKAVKSGFPEGAACLAELGTVQMEFTRLSEITGDWHYHLVVRNRAGDPLTRHRAHLVFRANAYIRPLKNSKWTPIQDCIRISSMPIPANPLAIT